MNGKRVLLTGATGHAGRPVLAELAGRGFDVTAWVRRPVSLEGCRTVVGNLAAAGLNPVAAAQLREEVAAADAVVHLASPRAQTRNAVVLEDILGTGALIDAWRTGPFVYASSPTIHGVPCDPLAEDAPTDLMSWYDMGKFCNEFQLRRAPPLAGRGPGISLRPGLIFGAGERRHDRQLLAEVYAQCRRGGTFVFDSEEGLETYGSSFIGGADFGRAIADALAVEAAGAYFVAGGFCTWRELIESVNRHAGTHAGFVIRPEATPEADELRLPQSRTVLDVSAFTTQTGFVPRQSLDDLVGEFINRECVERLHVRPGREHVEVQAR